MDLDARSFPGMTTTLAAEIAVLATGVAVLVGIHISRHWGKKSDEELAGAIEGVTARLDTMAQELQEARERDPRRTRIFGELAGTIDLDEVLERILQAAGAVPGVDAAVIRISAGGTPIVSALGISIEEGEERSIEGPPDGRLASAVTVKYRYGEDDELTGGADLIRSGAAVPIPSELGPIGTLSVFTRAPSRELAPSEIEELEELALRAGPAIENARRFREARQLADLDALTGLHNRRYFHETLGREAQRAHRYDRNLALIVFDLDDFKAINDRIGHLAGDAVLAEAAERVRDVVRSVDIACRVGGDEFAIILPESTIGDADQLYRRLQAALSSRPLGQAGRLELSAGVTDLQPEDDAVSFFQRADDALYRAKEAGKGQAVSATGS
jgi:diguanylate cyclase (GGDEF)-like protein